LTHLFADQAKPLALEIGIELLREEKEYLVKNAERLITLQAWQALVPELAGWRAIETASFATQYRAREAEVKEIVEKDIQLFSSEIRKRTITAEFSAVLDKQPTFRAVEGT